MIEDRYFTAADFDPGQHDEPEVRLPIAAMRRMVAQALTEGGIPGITVEKIGEQIPTSDGLSAEHLRTTVATKEAGSAYAEALNAAYADLARLEERDATGRRSVTLPTGETVPSFHVYGALTGDRMNTVRHNLANIIVPRLSARQTRHSS